MNGSVVVVNYDPRWPRLFEEESARVREAAAGPMDKGFKPLVEGRAGRSDGGLPAGI